MVPGSRLRKGALKGKGHKSWVWGQAGCIVQHGYTCDMGQIHVSFPFLAYKLRLLIFTLCLSQTSRLHCGGRCCHYCCLIQSPPAPWPPPRLNEWRAKDIKLDLESGSQTALHGCYCTMYTGARPWASLLWKRGSNICRTFSGMGGVTDIIVCVKMCYKRVIDSSIAWM